VCLLIKIALLVVTRHFIGGTPFFHSFSIHTKEFTLSEQGVSKRATNTVDTRHIRNMRIFMGVPPFPTLVMTAFSRETLVAAHFRASSMVMTRPKVLQLRARAMQLMATLQISRLRSLTEAILREVIIASWP